MWKDGEPSWWLRPFWGSAFEESFLCQFLFCDHFYSKGHGNGTVTEKHF